MLDTRNIHFNQNSGSIKLHRVTFEIETDFSDQLVESKIIEFLLEKGFILDKTDVAVETLADEL